MIVLKKLANDKWLKVAQFPSEEGDIYKFAEDKLEKKLGDGTES